METIQCSKCGSVFEKTGAKDKLRRFKDKRFMTTFHCPNCDARVILKNGEEPIALYLKRLERLKEQARRLGDKQEVNELQEEIDQIHGEIKMNAEKTKDKKFSMKGKDAYDPTKPKNIAKAKALSVAQGKAASDEEAYDPLDPENILKEKELAKARGAAAADKKTKDVYREYVTSHNGVPIDLITSTQGEQLIYKAIEAGGKRIEIPFKEGFEDTYEEIVAKYVPRIKKMIGDSKTKDSLFKGQKVTAIKSEQGLREGEVYTVLGEEAIIKQIVGENDTTVYKLQDSSGNVIVIESPEGLFYETKDANIFNRIKMAIEQEKQKLKKSPIRENFGQNIIRKLKDKYRYNDLIYGTPEERSAARLIDQFNDWCMNYTGDSKTKDENGYIAFYKGKRIEVYANTKYEAQQKAAKLLGAKKSYEVNIELAEKDGEQVIHKAVDADGDEETDSLKVKIGDIKKNMDAARKMGFDTAPYQKEIDKLEVKDGESITYKGCRIVLTELDDEWKYSVYQGSKKLVDGTDFDKQSARISAEDEIDAFLSKDAKVKDALMECMECGHKFDKRISPTTFEIKCPKCGGYDVDVMYGDAVVRGNYTVTINKSGQVLEFNVEASSDAEARTKAVAALELKMGLRKGSLQNEFDGTKNNIEVKVNDSFDFYTKDPLTKKGQKILAAMKKAYGEEKGEQIFYASRNKGTIKGVDKRTSDEELKTFTFKGKTITGR